MLVSFKEQKQQTTSLQALSQESSESFREQGTELIGTELIEAISKRETHKAQTILSQHPHLINRKFGVIGFPPIMAAAFIGDKDTVQALLTFKPDLEATSSQGDSIKTVIEIGRSLARQENQADMLSDLDAVEELLDAHLKQAPAANVESPSPP